MDSEEGPINFYSCRQKYGVFSNFFRGKITIDDQEWKSVEHYFQSQKYFGISDDHLQQVRDSKSPKDALELGNNTDWDIRDDWDTVKDDVMYKGVYAKFSQREKMNKTLLSTGNRAIVEHTVNDSYWGDGGDGTGRNMLGKILMRVREDLRNNEKKDKKEKKSKKRKGEDLEDLEDKKKKKRKKNK